MWIPKITIPVKRKKNGMTYDYDDVICIHCIYERCDIGKNCPKRSFCLKLIKTNIENVKLNCENITITTPLNRYTLNVESLSQHLCGLIKYIML